MIFLIYTHACTQMVGTAFVSWSFLFLFVTHSDVNNK